MAWNEPGGGRDKDPWGDNNDQGPPDLDEAFKKLQNNLSEMFGGGKGGSGSGSGGGGRAVNRGMISLGAVALLVIWALMGVYQIDQQERGVVLRFGEALDEIVMPGLHWNPPIIDNVLTVNVTQVRSRTHEAEMLTEDENIVKVKMTVQYVVENANHYLLNVRDPDTSLYQATESALRHAVGGNEMHDVLTEGRAELGLEVQERVQLYMGNYGTGVQVIQVNIDETAPPDAVRAAFDDVIKAREDEVRLRNEANAYAMQVIPEARGDAQRQLEEAEAYKQTVIAQAQGEASRFLALYKEYELSPEVTRERIYLDTIESVLSKSTKVMIDAEGGNNILYLPLDKIVERSSGSNLQGINPDRIRSDVNRELNRRSNAASRRDRN